MTTQIFSPYEEVQVAQIYGAILPPPTPTE